MKKQKAAAGGAGGVKVEMSSQVARSIRQHARSSMSAEICGVLIGAAHGGTTCVEAAIRGEDARQGGSHVTFTQETWTHIYQVKDAQYPDKRIVGWYHSHPGFGIFLSDHDLFIHKNFFSDQSQVAWVFDPHSDEEGCFVWAHGEIVRTGAIGLRDDPSASIAGSHAESRLDAPDAVSVEPERRKSKAGRWVGLTLSHLLVLLVGILIGTLLFPVVLVLR